MHERDKKKNASTFDLFNSNFTSHWINAKKEIKEESNGLESV